MSVDHHQRAVRFFWRLLFAATGASIAWNVANAVLGTTTGGPAMAAAAAVIPPAGSAALTHGVALLVRARTTGWVYWCALAGTIALAACTFSLSFVALRDFAERYLGYSALPAILWSLSIDLAIAVSTLALLALTGAPKRGAVHDDAPPVRNGALLHHLDAPVSVDGAHHATADDLIGAGVTRIERDKVAAVLAELADGTAPSTVARRLSVGYQTVARIAEAALATTKSGAPVTSDRGPASLVNGRTVPPLGGTDPPGAVSDSVDAPL